MENNGSSIGRIAIDLEELEFMYCCTELHL